MPIKWGSEMLLSVTATKQAPSTQQKPKNTKPFIEKVWQRQNMARTSDNCPSKSDGEVLPMRFEI